MDDDERTSQAPGGGTDAQGSAGGPGHHAPGGGSTVGSGELDARPGAAKEAEAPPRSTATGDLPAQDAADARAGAGPETAPDPENGDDEHPPG